MVKCELCGAEIRGSVYKIVLEGAELFVCSRCAKGRAVVAVLNLSQSGRGQSSRRTVAARKPRVSKLDEYVVVEGYGEMVRRARESMGLTREALAAMVGEKESTIRRIEAEQLEPTLELARKLEKVLRVKLLERVDEEPAGFEGFGENHYGYSLTLGDVAEFRE
uniref:TIGR00270 family protein n=1 Tax=Thermofilum pendens TaxID=2269 RepID=A0A7C4FED4_THEPE